MTAKEKMTAPIASVGADVEQPLQNFKTNQSIADLPGKGNLQATNNAENTAKLANKKNPDDLEIVSMMELYDTAYPPKLPIIDGLLYNGTCDGILYSVSVVKISSRPSRKGETWKENYKYRYQKIYYWHCSSTILLGTRNICRR